jgi:hypothetical protein
VSLIAQAVFRPFETNARAYALVADLKTLTFDLEVRSIPDGATISYSRRGDKKLTPHTSPTNSIVKGLPFAIWIFHFDKQGFKSRDIEFDPFTEPNLVMTIALDK